MFCHKCGAQIAEGAIFCHKCGTQVVYEDPDLHKPGVELEQITVENFHKKRPKFISSVLAIILILALVKSGILQDVFEKWEDVNREIHNSATGATTVPAMQPGFDSFPETSDTSAAMSANSSESSFAWVEEAHMVTEGDIFKTRYIVGAIENISDITFVSASVKFILYDSTGNQIDTTSDFINNFKAGNTWRFKAIVTSDDVANFEFLYATKTYP